MSKYADFYSAIGDIKDLLLRDLIGPVEKDEVIESVDPLSYYVMGILWAKRLDRAAEPAQDDDAEELSLEAEIADEYEDEIEGGDCIAGANAYRPSAMGVSVMLPPHVETLEVSFSYGKYTCSEREESAPVKGGGDEKVNKIRLYSRTQHIAKTTIKVPSVCKAAACPEHDAYHNSGVDITLTVRKIMNDGCKLITVSAANALSAPQKKRSQNEAALFQCELTLAASKGFMPVYQPFSAGQSTDDKINAMLYRSVLNYAYGHGCSVSCKEDGNGKVTTITSSFAPSEEVFQMMPGIVRESDILRLSYWENANRGEACGCIERFVAEYGEWRQKQASLANALTNCSVAANAVLERIDKCILRLRNGISALQNDDTAWDAFLLMNEAMLLQRIKTKGLSEAQAQTVTWYPFQLAYILQVIPDIVNPESDYRSSVDLLWFPTGGGKTEAYLGVAAFTIFFRRLSALPDNDGVTIIMRYTLRLLTIQQFERAAALICACEHLRRERGIPGGEISIGLWIGSGMTPNHTDNGKDDCAAKILERLRQDVNVTISEGNPVQITSCPWCGEPVDLDGYEVVDHKLVIRCSNNPHCEFHDAIPIYVVDDDVYAKKPTLLLSTIDKFARIAWELKSKSLFGDKCAPPELVIQDELHLISGPLGSLAGIYEIAVDYLSSRKGRPPKVIASTATVKNAAEQIRSLYNRPAVQFPPSGVSYDDSFFAVRAGKDDRPVRTYLGLCEAGGSLADLMLRVYSNLTFAKALFIKQGRDDRIVDQFATIIGYFNALKDLGATDNIIRDRMFSNIQTLVKRKFKYECDSAGLTLAEIKYGIQDELTSRKSSKEIKETLGKLEVSYPDNRHYSVVLASNMLSVGIDINRLGLMTVYNQPKSNAEYIQATSRVGRQNPGLVITMFNAARSRDKSHYEQFGYYHKAFYQYVEASSVTPYSARALEKALHCVFVALLRLTVDTLGANDYAVKFKSRDAAVRGVSDYIIERIRAVQPDSAEIAADCLAEAAKEWEYLARENPDTLVYTDYSGSKVSLLRSAGQYSNLDFPLVLNSLRNVDESSNVFISERS